MKMDARWTVSVLVVLSSFHSIARIDAKALSEFKCPDHKFRCKTEKCIPSIWKCDGDDDCGDGSDEAECVPATCRPNLEFACGNRKCIPKRWQCDSEKDCADESDEKNCPKPTCRPNFFQCNNTRCVPAKWKCDKQDDCGDKSDELNCGVTTASCKTDEFRCTDGVCIIAKWECDGDRDCRDGTDESNCTKATKACTTDEYKCSNNQCIPKGWRCDGNDDCFDHSDEANCATQKKVKTCGSLFWQCANTDCIKKDWKCDGEEDCVDGSDEKNCNQTTCAIGHFACRDGKQCIGSSLRCDGKNDCTDGSDEKHCGTSKLGNCTAQDFNCSANVCVSFDKVCDGRKDCLKGEDEPHNCNINECMDQNGHCSHTCTDQKISYKCSCPSGFTLDSDERTCTDVDECSIFGMCHQNCENVKGHFKCSCANGFYIEADNKTCKAAGDKEWVYFSNRVDIRKISPDGKDYRIVVGGLRGVVSLDFHVKYNHIYWTDILTDQIQRANIDGSYNTSADIIRMNVHTPDGLAVDWINDKLYWTDTGYKTIEVSDLNGQHNTDVVQVGLNEPRAIALDPHAGYIYWTDWGSQAAIERISMDGKISTRKVLVDKNLYWPNGLTIDLIQRRLYWVDAKLQRAEAVGLDGTNRIIIKRTGFYHPFALDNFADQLYWTDWKSDKLSSVSKFDASQVSTIKDGLFAPMGIKVYHKNRQTPGVNRCGGNHGCSHLCLLANHNDKPTFSCSCPRGMVLVGGKECQGTPQPRTAAPLTRPVTTEAPKSQSTTQKIVTQGPGVTVVGSMKGEKKVESSGTSVGTIIAIVLSIVVALGLLCVLLVFLRRRNLSKGNVMYYKDMSSTPLEDDFDIEQDDLDEKAKIVTEYTVDS